MRLKIMSPGKRIIVVAIIGILLAGFGFSQINYNLKQQLNADLLLFKTTANSYTMDANIPSSLGKFTFTHIPLEDDAYDSITPLGNLNRCPKLTHLGHFQMVFGSCFIGEHLPWGMNLSALAGVLRVSPPNWRRREHDFRVRFVV